MSLILIASCFRQYRCLLPPHISSAWPLVYDHIREPATDMARLKLDIGMVSAVIINQLADVYLFCCHAANGTQANCLAIWLKLIYTTDTFVEHQPVWCHHHSWVADGWFSGSMLSRFITGSLSYWILLVGPQALSTPSRPCGGLSIVALGAKHDWYAYWYLWCALIDNRHSTRRAVADVKLQPRTATCVRIEMSSQSWLFCH